MSSISNIDALRKEYARVELDLADTPSDPIVQFERWLEEALRAEAPEPNGMTLSTATADGIPSSRIVLLKGLDAGSFLFYTNYESQKGRELSENPYAALTFLWHEMQRQVRVQGKVEKLSPEASTAYFQSRPKGSQIGAWVSPQSSSIKSREVLQGRVEELKAFYQDEEQLPRPEHWAATG